MSNQRRTQAKAKKMIKIGKNLSKLSAYSCQPKTKEELKFIIKSRMDKEGPNCDLNDIDVSLITDMTGLFYDSDFNGNISRWDVSNVIDMKNMFAYSDFNGDISKWNVNNVINMKKMFAFSKFNQYINNWDVSNVENMELMFKEAKFDGDISNWKINERCATYDTFFNCPIKEEHKPKALQK